MANFKKCSVFCQTLARSSSHRYSIKRFAKFRENLPKIHICVSDYQCFLWILGNFQEQLFYRTPPENCFSHFSFLRTKLDLYISRSYFFLLWISWIPKVVFLHGTSDRGADRSLRLFSCLRFHSLACRWNNVWIAGIISHILHEAVVL